MTSPTPVAIDVCVCTFRRSHLVRTLKSIAALEPSPEYTISVVIADNDVTPSAFDAVTALKADFPFPLHYVHCPASNISIARNACLDTASGDYVAFVDDDETVSQRWLGELLAAAREGQADAVLGPVVAHYESSARRWLADGDFHSTTPVFVNGEIITGYTCNVLFKRDGAARGLRFNLARGKTGGEDTEFFGKFHRNGGRIAYAPEALVYEDVPAQRAGMKWLLARRLRAGQTHGMLMMEHGGGPTLKASAVAVAKAGYCFAMAGLSVFSPVQWRRNVLRGVLHVGVVSAMIGAKETVQYGQEDYR